MAFAHQRGSSTEGEQRRDDEAPHESFPRLCGVNREHQHHRPFAPSNNT